MHRADLLSKLSDYQLRWPEEAGETQRFIEFIERCADCFERSLLEGHVTGAGWVVDRAGERCLLTHHRKLNRWLQLGGHADGDADMMRVAQKEVEEESGLSAFRVLSEKIFDLDIHLIPERKGVPAHYHYDVRFVFQVTGSEVFTVSHESHDLKWVAMEGLTEFTTEQSMLRMVQKWKDGFK